MKVNPCLLPLLALAFVGSTANAVTPDNIAYCQDKARQQLSWERQQNSMAEDMSRQDSMLQMTDPMFASMLAQGNSWKEHIKSKEQIMQTVKQVYDECLEKFGSEERQENEIRNWGSSNLTPTPKQPYQEAVPDLARSSGRSSSPGTNSLDLYNQKIASCNAQTGKVWTASGCRNLSDVVTNYGVK